MFENIFDTTYLLNKSEELIILRATRYDSLKICFRTLGKIKMDIMYTDISVSRHLQNVCDKSKKFLYQLAGRMHAIHSPYVC